MNHQTGTPSGETNRQKENTRPTRTLFFSALCAAAMIYSIMMSFIFLAGIIKNRWLTRVLSDYFPERDFSDSGTLLFTGFGLLLHLISITGIIFMIRLKRLGLYIYSAATIMLTGLPFLYGAGSLFSSAIFICLILIFALHAKRMS